MQQLADRLLLSASDLIDHLECSHLTQLDLGVATGDFDLKPTRTDAADLIARKGAEHEVAYLEALRLAGHDVVEIESQHGLDGLIRGAEQTRAAMHAGAEIIYQGVLFDGQRWRGYADFLERVDRPSALGAFSYEVADTKLARRVKPYFIMQLCFYSELLADIQGITPEWMSVVLGTQARDRFRLDEFVSYYRRVKTQFETTLDAGLGATYPDPVAHCGFCRWEAHCAAQREADDHLSLVANMRHTQTV